MDKLRAVWGAIKRFKEGYCYQWAVDFDNFLFRHGVAISHKLWILEHTDRKHHTYALTNEGQLMILYAFYDLQVAPATFDIVKFLVLAEKKRLELGCGSLCVVIVPSGLGGGFRKRDLEIYQSYGDYDIGYMEWRLRNILVPCCWLMPSCKSVMLCGDRNEAQRLMQGLVGYLYPEEYTVLRPVGRFLDYYIHHAKGELPSLGATAQARVYVSKWLKERALGRKVITINLRETVYESDRDSNLEAWKRFHLSLDKGKYLPLMIRDIEKAYELTELATFPEIPWNVELRLALYELSYLNMFVTGGHAGLALFDRKVNLLVFKIITNTCGSTKEKFLRRQGYEMGGQWKHATPLQRWVWEEDTFEVIQREFRDMCQKIEEGE